MLLRSLRLKNVIWHDAKQQLSTSCRLNKDYTHIIVGAGEFFYNVIYLMRAALQSTPVIVNSQGTGKTGSL